MVVYNYGVDLDSSFTFKDGDLRLAEYENNISQAISNRLNTVTGALDLFYRNYGSLFLLFLGWRRTDETLSLMKVELDNTLRQDPRIGSFSTSLEYVPEGVSVQVLLNDFADTELNFILNGNGVEIIEEEV